MGMTIDKAIAKIWHCIVSIRDCTGNKEFVEALELSIETMRKYQMFQDQSLSLYMERLKADMVAMLTELQMEIEELDNPLDYDFEGYNQCAVDCEKLIQEKINALKENTDGTISN